MASKLRRGLLVDFALPKIFFYCSCRDQTVQSFSFVRIVPAGHVFLLNGLGVPPSFRLSALIVYAHRDVRMFGCKF